ncbi:unnamed protein product [Prunus armeniaca]|uniref:Legumain prodomain domain-containing protein n=1 Tax=Prunus armeniaca TaxID=36596 RepID=A0A6J5U9M6_PRUAR|nr:unnamed protein product [Prunus armeniaca]
MARQSCGALIFLACLSLTAGSLCLPAVLVAGSNGYGNYRHQANVCHAYQILKKGGLKDEYIIVFMYDDIVFNTENPRQGVIINKPKGHDVYKGVPKDYTGDDVNADNLYAVILGNKSTLSGGSGKVLRSGPNDHIFICYTDHGAAGLLGMPTGTPSVFAIDLIDVLKKKHAAKCYKSMVFYLEACESGSIFEGLLPKNVSIYATTSANAEEDGYFVVVFHNAPAGSHTKLEAQKQLLDEIAHRKLASGQPLVDDWDCFKMLMRTYENNCGPLSNYGMKYTRAIANMGNAGVTTENMAAVSDQTCSKKPDVQNFLSDQTK